VSKNNGLIIERTYEAVEEKSSLTDRIAEFKTVVSMLLTMNFGWESTLRTGKVLIRSIGRELAGLLL